MLTTDEIKVRRAELEKQFAELQQQCLKSNGHHFEYVSTGDIESRNSGVRFTLQFRCKLCNLNVHTERILSSWNCKRASTKDVEAWLIECLQVDSDGHLPFHPFRETIGAHTLCVSPDFTKEERGMSLAMCLERRKAVAREAIRIKCELELARLG